MGPLLIGLGHLAPVPPSLLLVGHVLRRKFSFEKNDHLKNTCPTMSFFMRNDETLQFFMRNDQTNCGGVRAAIRGDPGAGGTGGKGLAGGREGGKSLEGGLAAEGKFLNNNSA